MEDILAKVFRPSAIFGAVAKTLNENWRLAKLLHYGLMISFFANLSKYWDSSRQIMSGLFSSIDSTSFLVKR
jgi:hypothetical protein